MSKIRNKSYIILIIVFLLLISGCNEEYTDIVSSENQVSSEELPHMESVDEASFVYLNNNIPYFSETDKKRTDAFENYSSLDTLGRCGQAYANICKEIMPTQKRGEIGNVRPSGWHTVKYNDLIDGNYLYNRCHLIGYQLAGENANEKNLITGTRYLNVTGMLPFENLVASYVEETDNHVLYRVTPVFDDENLVASGVQIEAWSVEDKGEGICFNVYCYNIQPQIQIDYRTGESWIADELEEGNNITNNEDKGEQSDFSSENNSEKYVVNINSGKIHRINCSSVSEMKENNRMYYTGNLSDLENCGYKKCKRCLN